jgi:dihydroorotase
MNGTIAIGGGRVIDPANGVDAVADVVIAAGRIATVGSGTGRDAAEALDASGLVVCPGFVDIHTHLREPGFEHKETIASGTRAAAHGGFTTVCAMPNTEPPTDCAAAVEFVLKAASSAGVVRVLPIGCATRGRAGGALADLAELERAGAVAFSDDGAPVCDAHLMRRALEYAGMLGVPVIDHCEERALVAGGVMHEGWVSARLGLRGVPSAAEEAIVARDIALAKETGGHVHIAHVSTGGSVEMIRNAKAMGVSVSAEVTPHHLAMTHEAVLLGPGEAPGGLAYDTNAKVNPPLRTRADVEACVTGLRDGTIDCIATDHAPHSPASKDTLFQEAPFGIIGFESAFSVLHRAFVETGRWRLDFLIEKMSLAPARVLGAEWGTLRPGSDAELALLRIGEEFEFDESRLRSRSRNSPWLGERFGARVACTVSGGRAVFEEEGARRLAGAKGR